MIKPYVVTTNTAYTIITLARSRENAIQKVAKFYFDEYGENRDDWIAYDLTTEYLSNDDIWEI